MEQIVTGCDDCPFKDSAGGEYDKYCNHPNRGIGVRERFIGSNNLFDVRDVPEPLKSELINRYKQDNEGRYDIEGKTYFVYNLPLDLYKEKPYLDYPNWCPLIIEPIIIKSNNHN